MKEKLIDTDSDISIINSNFIESKIITGNCNVKYPTGEQVTLLH